MYMPYVINNPCNILLNLLASCLYSSCSYKPQLFSLPGKQRDVGVELVKSLQNTQYSLDEKLEKSFISLFGKKPIVSSEPHETVDQDLTTESAGPSESDEDSESDEEGDTGDENGLESLDGKGVRNNQSPLRSTDDSSDDETFHSSEQHHATQRNLKEEIDLHGGRMRRKVVFDQKMDIDDEVNLWQVTKYSALLFLYVAFNII